jgi:hypothetical protein
MKNKYIALIAKSPWHIICFAIYPPLALLAHNKGEVGYEAAYRSMIVSAVFFLLSLLAFHIFFRDMEKAGILNVFFIFSFCYYEYAFGYASSSISLGSITKRHIYFLPIWFGSFFLVGWLVAAKLPVDFISVMFRTAGVVLLISPLHQLAAFQRAYPKSSAIEVHPISVSPHTANETSPDVYFIILDMYGRDDVLTDEFGYGSTIFLRSLRKMGFYVASCSQSNYPNTAPSLSATLNGNYLQELLPQGISTRKMWYLIQNSAVENAFRKEGYKIIAFETDYRWTEWRDADIYYRLHSGSINYFESILLRSSVLGMLTEKSLVPPSTLTSDKRKYELIRYELDELNNVPEISGPKFVFVHLTVPHPFFVFGPNGEFAPVYPRYENNELYYTKDDFIVGYRNQVEYISSRITEIVGNIIKNSAQPPIIILQGDHGPRFIDINKQFGILNAYYFPDPKPELQPFLSPVNNFRIVFGSYFGASLPLLDNRSYLPKSTEPGGYRNIPNDCVVETK